MSFTDQDALEDNQHCFACGQHNPDGLGMVVSYPEPEARCNITLPDKFQGWAGMAHGGVTATLLDEIMAHAVIRYVGFGVTISFSMRYRGQVPLGEELVVRGWVEDANHRRAKTEATVETPSGKVLAQGEAVFLLRN